MAGGQLIDGAKRKSAFLVEPERLTVIGVDTRHKATERSPFDVLAENAGLCIVAGLLGLCLGSCIETPTRAHARGELDAARELLKERQATIERQRAAIEAAGSWVGAVGPACGALADLHPALAGR